MAHVPQPAPASSTPNRPATGTQQDVIRFRRFTLLSSRRTLLRDDRTVDIGSRAFDLLTLLVSARGTLVTKRQIFEHVWPSTIVEESNLRFQMASLRKALGDDGELIKTIPGRGYIFIDEGSAGTFDSFDEGTARVVPVPDYQVGIAEPHADDRRSPDVALIDHDESASEELCRLLDSIGIRTERYTSVQAFLENRSPQEPKCLVLDAWMPGRSGLDFQADLRRENIDTPVVFVSGHADVHTAVRAMKAGAIDFLTKPVRHEDFLATIRSVT